MTTRTLQEAQEERGQLAATMQELADRQEQWNAEDHETWANANERYDDVMGEIEQFQLQNQIAQRRQQMLEDEERIAKPPRNIRSGMPPQFNPARPRIDIQTRSLALQAWMCDANDLVVTDEMQRAAADCNLNFRSRCLDVKLRTRSPMQGFEMFCIQGGRLDWAAYDDKRAIMEREERQMNTTTPGEGSEFIPETFHYELERAMLAYGGFRRVSRILPTGGGNPLRWPTVDDTANKAYIVAENADIGSHTAPTTGQIDFLAYKYTSAPVLVTAELLEDSAFNLPALLGSMLGERLGRGQADHLATGNGTSQPQGIVTGASAGHTAAAATLAADDLIDLQGSIDPAYEGLPSVGWAFNKNTLTAIRKLKLTDDQYIWQPGLRAAEPDLLLGAPYTIVQEMADIGSSAVPIVYGAFEKFVIRDVASVRFYRLEELYRANDNTGFVALHRIDSKVIQPAAIKKLTMGV